MFKRYGEVMLRLEELGARAGKLSNSDRHELQSLLEEQTWLGTTIVKKTKSVLEEIDGTFEKLFDWMIDISDLIDHAAGEEGTPEDLLELEKMMVDAVSLRDQMKRLNLDKRITRAAAKRTGHARRDALLEAAPTAVPVCVDDLPAPVTGLPGDKESRQTFGESKSVGENEPSVTLSASPLIESPAVSTAAVEPIAALPVKSSGTMSKKSRKKKVKGVKLFADEQYRPPRELLVSIAEKIAPQARQQCSAGLPGDAEQAIALNLREPKI
ncbi:hypothetical protein [Desulfoscipio sp. XC116]|uniref:hypothetical protein n=1 Tax=Desulfoscipio sp. XC116 TaxID=3144975 RepID=UPI00325ADE26